MFSPARSKNKNTHHRLSVILICSMAMLGLIIYGKVYNPAVTLEMCLIQPDKYDGRTIAIGTEITVHEIFPDGFTIKQFGRIVKVKGRAGNIAPDDFITLSAVFHKQGWLELKSYHVAKKRRFKIFVSIFPALLVVFIFFKSYTFDLKRFVFTERH